MRFTTAQAAKAVLAIVAAGMVAPTGLAEPIQVSRLLAGVAAVLDVEGLTHYSEDALGDLYLDPLSDPRLLVLPDEYPVVVSPEFSDWEVLGLSGPAGAAPRPRVANFNVANVGFIGADDGRCTSEWCWIGSFVEDFAPFTHCGGKDQAGAGRLVVEVHRWNRQHHGALQINGEARDWYTIKLTVQARGFEERREPHFDSIHKFEVWMDVDHPQEGDKAQRLFKYEPRGTHEGGFTWNIDFQGVGVGGTISEGKFDDVSKPEQHRPHWKARWGFRQPPPDRVVSFDAAVVLNTPLDWQGHLTPRAKIEIHAAYDRCPKVSTHEMLLPFYFGEVAERA